MATDGPTEDPAPESSDGNGSSADDGVALEVAYEAINGAVGAYNGRIAAERSKPQPDLTAIARWERGIDACIVHRESLRLADQDTIAATRKHFNDLVLDIREGRA
jgi:hypothetical protein